MDKIIAELSEAQLANFKLHNECVQHAKTKLDLSMAEVAKQIRDAEIVRLKSEVYRYSECVRKQDAYDRAVKEYQAFKDKLSKELGIELEGKSVCPISGVIKEVASSKPKE